MQTKIRPPFKVHGGKYYLASWIMESFPADHKALGYIEPYVRAGGFFFNKERSASVLGEAINDMDEGLIQIYRALRDEPGMFVGRLKRIKYCLQTFRKALNKDGPFKDYMDHAVGEFVLRKMSRGGLKKAFTGEEAVEVKAWESTLEELPRIAERLQGVFLFSKPPLEALSAYDDTDIFAFVDPPAVAESVEVGEYEMSTDDHLKLFEILNVFRGKVLLSGTPSVLYKRLYCPANGWKCIRKKTNVKTKIDCVWVNYQL